jgi:flagellar protein FliS
MNAHAASKTYANVGVDSGALSADPHKLISMLYQGALLAIAHAKNGMIQISDAKKIKGKNSTMYKEVSAKCAAISKAIAIIDDGLSASLNKKEGGALAQNLLALYEYMGIRLTQANIKNDIAALDEVAQLLNDLKNAWEAMRTTDAASVPAASTKPAKVSLIHAAPAAPPPSQFKPAPITTAIKMPPQNAVVAPQSTPQQRVANKMQMLYGRV